MALRLIRSYQRCRTIAFKLFCSAEVLGKPICKQPLLLYGLGSIEFEGRVTIGYFPSPMFLSTYAHIEARKTGARIKIKNGTHINNNFCAIAEHTSITIGESCRIGANVEIFDSDFHGVNPSERSSSKPEWAKPVTIGNNVFIGSNVKILKGVTVGEDAVIASGAVVSKDIPAGVIAAGNPAQVVKQLQSNKTGIANE